jgi:hypothetical protein
LNLPGLGKHEAAIITFYQDVILRNAHDNNEMLDMTNSNMGLSGELVINILVFVREVAREVETPGAGNLPPDMRAIIQGMSLELRKKKMASFLIWLDGLVVGRDLGQQRQLCLSLATDIHALCNRFFSAQ